MCALSALVSLGHEVEVVHCVDAYRLKKGNSMPQDAADAGVIVPSQESLRLSSPVITQQTGHPGLKARALRNLCARRRAFPHISLVGGPAIIPWSRGRSPCHAS
jgi:hypothetical protein